MFEKLKLSHYTLWRRLRERRYSSYSFSTSALDRGEWSASRPGRALPPGEWTPGTHCTGGWVGSRAGLDTSFRLFRGSNLNRPVVKTVARHYTDWATRLTQFCIQKCLFCQCTVATVMWNSADMYQFTYSHERLHPSYPDVRQLVMSPLCAE
jgi:hypothetical protein